MKLISGVNGRIIEGLSEISDLKEDEEQRNIQFSEFSVVMVRSGPRLLKTLDPKHFNLISKKVTAGSIICSDTWKAYTGIASRGYVPRLVNHGEKQYSDGKRNHINGLEGFWGYLKRKLVLKGGIR
jgi:hypothetical protein